MVSVDMNSFIVEGQFFNPTKGSLSFDQILQELVSYMEEKPHKRYEVIVGCDSSSSEDPNFPVAVVVLRVGEGGRFFLRRIHYPAPKRFYNLHERILQEVLLSCQLALVLRERLAYLAENEKFTIPYEFQYIHADIGQHGPTKDMIREVAGLIRGNGFEPKIKPESFVASTVADRYS